jgi:hypothetical protein
MLAVAFTLALDIEDIARRLALDNFVASGPDALFPLCGYPGDEDKDATSSRSATSQNGGRVSSPRPSFRYGRAGLNGYYFTVDGMPDGDIDVVLYTSHGSQRHTLPSAGRARIR